MALTCIDERLDLELVASSHAGDPTALPALLARHHRRMLAAAHGVLHDRYRAEDAVQEAAIRVWRGLPAASFATPGHVAAWVRQIVHNAALDMLRAEARQPSTITVHDDLDAVLLPDHADLLADRLLLEVTVRTALAALTDDDQRDTVVRVDLLEQTTDRVAAETGTPAATVRTRLHRGRRKLRKILAQPVAFPC